MTYSINTFLLCSAYGKDRGLSTPEIVKLSEFIQEELEQEIEWIVKLREVKYATK